MKSDLFLKIDKYQEIELINLIFTKLLFYIVKNIRFRSVVFLYIAENERKSVKKRKESHKTLNKKTNSNFFNFLESEGHHARIH